MIAPDGASTTSFSYDGTLVTGLMTTGVVPGQIAYEYDRSENGDSTFWIASRTVNGDAGTRVDYEYDADGLVTRAGALRLHRDAASGLFTGSSTRLVGEKVLDRNNFGEVMHVVAGYQPTSCGPATWPMSPCRVVLDQAFERDAVGRISTKTETIRDPIRLDSETVHSAFVYDVAGRLTTVRRDGQLVARYGYDGNGNRTSFSDGWGSGTATYDAQDRLLTYGDQTYTYTANGELLTKTQGSATTTYAYDTLGNLRHVSLPTGIAIDYVIDGSSRRIGKKVNGALVQGFLYAGGLAPLAETDGSGAVVSVFTYGTHGNVPDVMVRGETTYRLVTDYLGSVRWVLNATTGAVAQHLEYDAFGRVTLDTNPGFQPFGYAGGLYEPQTGLVRFGARDYDAQVGRWTAKDPIGFAGGDEALYNYAGSDPINAKDPEGTETSVCFGTPGDGDCELDDEQAVQVASFSAAFGDDLTLGVTKLLRGDNGVVDERSRAYSNGEWAGIAGGTVLGGLEGLGRSGVKAVGREFSHWIPDRVLKRTGSRWLRNVFGRSRFNGNFVTELRHFLHDPSRFPAGWRAMGRRFPWLLRQLDRIPWLYRGAAAGAAATGAAAGELGAEEP